MSAFFDFIRVILNPFSFNNTNEDISVVEKRLKILSFFSKKLMVKIINKKTENPFLFSYKSDPDKLELFIKYGSNHRDTDEFGRNLLFHTNNSKVLNILVKNGIDHTITDSKGFNVFHHGDIAVFQALVDFYDGQKITLPEHNPDRIYPLFHKNDEEMKLLITLGFDIHHIDKENKNALFFSNQETTKFLIENHIDVNVIDNSGKNALFENFNSAYFPDDNYKRMVYLLDAGIDIHCIDKRGFSALYEKTDDIVLLFINRGISIPENFYEYNLSRHSNRLVLKYYTIQKEEKELLSIMKQADLTLETQSRLKKRL